MPGLLDTGTSGYQEASNVPAAVADRVVEWRPDRSARCLEIGATLDQCQRNIDVIAARRPMKWSLSILVVVAPRVRISSGVNQQRDDGRPIRKVSGPVTDDVKRRTSSRDPGKPRRGKPRFCLEQPCQNGDITIVNRCDHSNRIAVSDHPPQAIPRNPARVPPPTTSQDVYDLAERARVLCGGTSGRSGVHEWLVETRFKNVRPPADTLTVSFVSFVSFVAKAVIQYPHPC